MYVKVYMKLIWDLKKYTKYKKYSGGRHCVAWLLMGIRERSGLLRLVGCPPTNLYGLQYGDAAHDVTHTTGPLVHVYLSC